jgi:1-acyl-sn-glycerol-3-phosphate acyltransferase
MVAKKELFSIPFFGWVIARTEFVPIDRGSRTSGHQASKKIAENIQSGLKVWVAPEGTRGDGHSIATFKKGSFAVAIDAQVPIVPIVLVNSVDAVPKNSFLPRSGVKIKVVLLPEISTKGFTVDQRGDLAVRVHQVMTDEFNRLKS